MKASDYLNSKYPNRKTTTKIKINYEFELKGDLEIREFPFLEEIDLKNNWLEGLTIDKISASNLEKVNFSSNRINKIEDFINNLNFERIKEIIIDNNEIKIKPEYLFSLQEKMSSLQKFDFSNDEPNNSKFQRNVLENQGSSFLPLNKEIFILKNTNSVELLNKSTRMKKRKSSKSNSRFKRLNQISTNSNSLISRQKLTFIGVFLLFFLLISYLIINSILKKIKVKDSKNDDNHGKEELI